MILGTGSHVGKSLMTAGLCRIFKQDGYNVAPFKSQNMALNSYATEAGGEMGRAQAVQAFASGIKPHIDMNPILLKPSSDTGAQVIMMGKVVGSMTAKTYRKFKSDAFPIAKKAFDRLSKKHDIIIMEGAGSPAEINIPDDMVNMPMAEHANAPALLIGDIDLGGVFAWIMGTLQLLKPRHRKLIKGFIINKFRGDIDILKPGLKQLETLARRPVLGVVPYLKALRIEEEDSVSSSRFRQHIFRPKNDTDKINIEVLYLPHISNFTDFDPFLDDEDVNLRYVKMGDEITNPDIIIIPGTKNTISDYRTLKRMGYLDTIKKRIKSGTMLIGVCGGFQMLGLKIIDTKGSESNIPKCEGLGLLNFVTRLMPSKVVSQIKAVPQRNLSFAHAHASGAELTGYEIHTGRTRYLDGCLPAFSLRKRLDTEIEVDDGATDSANQVWGTYIHGIFDNNVFRTALLNRLRKTKGLPLKNARHNPNREKEFDRLAQCLRENLDIKKIYKIIGIR